VATLTGVVVVDVADPAAPILLGAFETRGAALAVDARDDDAVFVADWLQLRAWDLSDPVAPAPRGSERVPTDASLSRVRSVAVLDDGRILAGEWSGLHVYEHQDGCASPDVVLSRDVLRFDPLDGASSRAELVLVDNEGAATLEISDVVSSDAAVAADVIAFSVEPGASAPVEVVITSDAAGPGTLTFHTNDPDEPELVLPWESASQKLDLGDPAPSFLMVDLDANVWRTEDLIDHVTLLAYFATW
jgi:hypothetical protein